MNSINNITELRQERIRLNLQLQRLETEIENDIRLIRQDLEPVHKLVTTVSKFFGKDNNSLAGFGINAGIDFLIRKVVLRNAGWLYQLFIPGIVKDATGNLLADQGSRIVSAAKDLFKKWMTKKSSPLFDKTTVNQDY